MSSWAPPEYANELQTDSTSWTSRATRRILVAGIGNVSFRDDGFGVEVARRLLACDLPPGVVLRDVGVRYMHLADELLNDWDLVVAIEARARGSAPGTLHVVEPGASGAGPSRALDRYGTDLVAVLETLRSFGAVPPPVLLVGCDVADVSEGIGLTPQVADAIPGATRLVDALVRARVSLLSGTSAGSQYQHGDGH
jgi:hydrogenase maturation protease